MLGGTKCGCTCVNTHTQAESLMGSGFDRPSDKRQMMQEEVGLVADRPVGRLSQLSSHAS